MMIDKCKAEKVRYFLVQFEQYLQKEINGEIIMDQNEIIADFISEDKNRIIAAFAIGASLKELEIPLLEKLKEQLQKHTIILNRWKLQPEFDPHFGNQSGDTYLSFKVNNPDNLVISFGFDKQKTKFSVGIDPNTKVIDPILKQKIEKTNISSKIGKDIGYSTWYYLHYFKDEIFNDAHLSAWDDYRIWSGIPDGSLADHLAKYIDIIMSELEGAGLI